MRWPIIALSLSLSTASYSTSQVSPVPTHRPTLETHVHTPVEAPVNNKGTPKSITSKASIECLSLNLYYEARDESTASWAAVAFVTINRVIDKRYPDDICSVVWEPYQFSWTHDGLSDKPDESKHADAQAWKHIQQFAKGIVENYKHIEDPTGGAVLYHSHAVAPHWGSAYEVTGVVGGHVFYRNDNAHR